MHISKGLRQAYQVQDFAFEALCALKEALTKDGKLSVTREDCQAIRHLADVWQTAQQRISFHRHVPSPGVLKHEAEPKRKQRFGRRAEPVPAWYDPTSPDAPVPADGNGQTIG